MERVEKDDGEFVAYFASHGNIGVVVEVDEDAVIVILIADHGSEFDFYFFAAQWEAFIASSGAYAEGYFTFSRHNGGEDRVGNGVERLFNRVDLHRGKDSGGETFESEHEFKFLFNQIDLCCGERLAFGEFEPDASSYGADFKIFDSVQSLAHIADELLLEYAAVVAFDGDLMISAYN